MIKKIEDGWLFKGGLIEIHVSIFRSQTLANGTIDLLLLNMIYL